MIDVKKHSVTAKTTIMGQFISGFFAIAIPMTFLTITIFLLNQRTNITQPFIVEGVAAFLACTGVTVFTLSVQLEESLSAIETRKRAVKVAFRTGLFLNFIFSLCQLFEYNLLIFTIRFVIFQITPILSAYFLYYFILLWHKQINFDETTHEYIMSTESALQSCRNGALPYSYIVSTFWSYMFALLFSVFLTVLVIVLSPDFSDPRFVFTILIEFIALFIFFTSMTRLLELRHLEVKHSIGIFVASMRVSRGKTRTRSYSLESNSIRFSTDETLYHFVKNLDGETIRVWYTFRGVIKYAILAEKYTPTENPEDVQKRLKNQGKQVGS